jgi:protein involved in polysaccharide export with SLBB domain
MTPRRSVSLPRAVAVALVLVAILAAPITTRAQEADHTIAVTVLGIVQNPGTYSVRDGSRLSDAIASTVSRSGNLEASKADRLANLLAGADATTRPDFSRVFLTRTDPATGRTTSYQVNLLNALEKGDQRFDPILKSGDQIWVPSARRATPGILISAEGVAAGGSS